MVHSASTPAPDPSPVDLGTLLVHNSTGLAIRRKIVVLGTIETAPDRARSPPFPAPFTGPPANQGGPRIDSHEARPSPAKRTNPKKGRAEARPP